MDRDALFRAISEVESGNNPRAVGRHGERTVVQFLPSVWRHYSRVPMSRASSQEVRRVFNAHVDTLLKARSRNPRFKSEVRAVAVGWRLGEGIYKSGRVRADVLDYAERVGNLYAHFRDVRPNPPR